MVLQDPEIHLVLEEIWSTYIWSSVSPEMQSMPKMWNNRKLGWKVPILVHLNVINQDKLCLDKMDQISFDTKDVGIN